MRQSSLIRSCVLALPLLACDSAPRPAPDAGGTSVAGPAPLSDADRAAIEAADSAFAAAANAGNVDGVVAVYAPDGSLLPPNAPGLKGSEGIRRFWAGLLDAYTATFELETDEIDGRGDLAYVVGRYRLTGRPKGKAPALEDQGKYLEVLKRQPDGSWKYAVDMYNSDRPMK
jgi:uncharacterized protein (TIGR02246 family)